MVTDEEVRTRIKGAAGPAGNMGEFDFDDVRSRAARNQSRRRGMIGGAAVCALLVAGGVVANQARPRDGRADHAGTVTTSTIQSPLGDLPTAPASLSPSSPPQKLTGSATLTADQIRRGEVTRDTESTHPNARMVLAIDGDGRSLIKTFHKDGTTKRGRGADVQLYPYTLALRSRTGAEQTVYTQPKAEDPEQVTGAAISRAGVLWSSTTGTNGADPFKLWFLASGASRPTLLDDTFARWKDWAAGQPHECAAVGPMALTPSGTAYWTTVQRDPKAHGGYRSVIATWSPSSPRMRVLGPGACPHVVGETLYYVTGLSHDRPGLARMVRYTAGTMSTLASVRITDKTYLADFQVGESFLAYSVARKPDTKTPGGAYSSTLVVMPFVGRPHTFAADNTLELAAGRDFLVVSSWDGSALSKDSCLIDSRTGVVRSLGTTWFEALMAGKYLSYVQVPGSTRLLLDLDKTLGR